ncbi:hypothetical protein NITMOv2_4366 [Nitrospira moscoviensis]|uniref:Uncharacterized protein n=1 Tax=Nitrospira moscoviensis TaxID=42253 RepID=A0A0K2GJC9_NITMO|nr:hypothetical protein NITMOv2_4366 [Nitrospira moscoviensis]
MTRGPLTVVKRAKKSHHNLAAS